MSAQTLKVLGTLLSASQVELSGAEIGREARLMSGTLYPILARLEEAGWLSSRWESESPEVLGRPRRRFYSLTAFGVQKAKAAFLDIQTVRHGGLSWA